MTNAIYLVMQNTYDAIEIALFVNDRIIDHAQENKINASKRAIPLINTLLEKNNYNFSQLSFIAINQGPAPFTTLRVIIATANGLSFATSLPLIGVDGLHALLSEYQDNNHPLTIALLDAFNNDVYVAISEKEAILYSDCEKIDVVLEKIDQNYKTHKLRFIGNAALLYADNIYEKFHNRAVIPQGVLTCSIKEIGRIAYAKWQQHQDLSYQLFPLYLKHQYYKNQQGQLKRI